MIFLSSCYRLGHDSIRDWFFTSREDGMRRNLHITAYDDDSITPFIGQLKKV
jgi:hypothetical protein